MQVPGDADCFWLIWPPFSGWLKKLRNSEIICWASLGCNWTASAVFSCMPQPLPKVGVLLACLWQMHKLQIHKLASRCDHLNVSTMYSIFDWKEFELLSYRWVFLESTEISASEETNALEKVLAQFMPFQKLSGKFHFLVRFCTNNWNSTYVYAQVNKLIRFSTPYWEMFQIVNYSTGTVKVPLSNVFKTIEFFRFFTVNA